MIPQLTARWEVCRDAMFADCRLEREPLRRSEACRPATEHELDGRLRFGRTPLSRFEFLGA